MSAPQRSLTDAEITQQPGLWRQVAADVAGRRAEIDAFVAPVLDAPGARVVLTGAGSSAFAGAVLAPALTAHLRRRVDAVATTDIVAAPGQVLAEDVPTLLVSLARSGDSPESAAATAIADASLTSVRHLVVSCHATGRLATDHATDQAGAASSLVLLMPAAAHDAGFAMTSSFTCMLLATWLALAGGGSLDVDALAAAAQHLIDDRREDVAALATAGYDRVVFLGSGCLAALARESALKLLELTAGAVVSLSDSCLGFRHGPKAVLRPGTLVVVYLSNDPGTRAYDEDMVAELRGALGARHVVVVAAAPSTRCGEDVWRVAGVDDAPDVGLALPFVVAAQLLALHTSLAVGCSPDDPFPRGEVNRVVRGVTIHPPAGATTREGR